MTSTLTTTAYQATQVSIHFINLFQKSLNVVFLNIFCIYMRRLDSKQHIYDLM